MIEEWKFYKKTYSHRYGHRIYEVSNFGNVKCNGEIYKCSIGHGYYFLCGQLLHRIVAELFLPDWDPNKEVDHIDTNKLNNRVDNLRCVTRTQNQNNPLTKKHISKSCIGRIPWNKNKHWNEETKKKISNSIKGKTWKLIDGKRVWKNN